jgi:hypothetical protein
VTPHRAKVEKFIIDEYERRAPVHSRYYDHESTGMIEREQGWREALVNDIARRSGYSASTVRRTLAKHRR